MVKIMVAATLPMLSVATSCADLCTDGGHGSTGFISGTAPACGGTCADCGDGHCYQVEKGSVSDYGSGCWSGHKVCCCSKEMHEASPSNQTSGMASQAMVSSSLQGFDYGSDNIICDEWYGTMQGGGHSQASCLSFCDADDRCFYATHFADTGYCHVAVTCSRTQQTNDHPITYHKTTALESPPSQVEKTVSDFEDADVDSKVALKGFDYGSDNVICDEWYGTMQGGGHSQASCLSFCDADDRCFYATHFADTGYCHIAVTCSRTQQTNDHPITYHKTTALELPQVLPQDLSQVEISVPSCAGLCTDGGHGTTGFMSGTAPACGGTCADCGDGHCYQVEKGSVSDYGSGCWSGHKVCCCSKEMHEASQTVI